MKNYKSSSGDTSVGCKYLRHDFPEGNKIKSLPLIPKEDWNKFCAMSVNDRVKYVEKLKGL